MKIINNHFTPYEVQQMINELSDHIYAILPNDMKSNILVVKRHPSRNMINTKYNIYTSFEDSDRTITYLVQSSISGDDPIWDDLEEHGISIPYEMSIVLFPDIKFSYLEDNEEEYNVKTVYKIKHYDLYGIIEK